MSRWEENTAQWYEQKMIYCELCGRLIPKRFWSVEIASRKMIFCGPDCEQLYRSYRMAGQPLESDSK